MLPAFLRTNEERRVPSLFETVRLVYFDESGSAPDDEKQPVLVLAALVVHGDLQTLPIEQDARKIVDTLVPEKLRAKFEFHAKDLFPKHGRYRAAWDRGERLAVLTEFLRLLPKHNLPVLYSAVNKASFRQEFEPQIRGATKSFIKHLPLLAAFVLCGNEVEGWFRRNAQFDRGFCIADETAAKLELRQNFRTLRQGFPGRGPGAQPMQLDHLIDMIYFGNSHESMFLQLVDACALVIRRIAERKDDPETKALYGVMESQVWPKPIRVGP